MLPELDITVRIRLAKNSDILVATGLLKIGAAYYIKDLRTNTFSGVYCIDAYHSYSELRKFQEQRRIFVPVIEFSNDITNVLQQQDLKAITQKPIPNR